MKKIFKIIPIVIILFFSLWSFAWARENVNYWYIKDFQSEINVQPDSSLLILEKITADCGNASGKHGIFRILPTQIKFSDGSVKETPVELLDITDQSGKPLKYSESYSSSDKTLTWKIGDPERTVTGVNYYFIKYRVYNAISFDSPNFDELYWNLSGNFWDIEIDNFEAKIHFPPEANKNNSEISYYTGPIGSKNNDLATYSWSSDSILAFSSTRTLPQKQGITASVTFPKGIFSAYLPSNISSKYKQSSASAFPPVNWSYAIAFPLAWLILLLFFWLYFGKDPEEPKTIIAEYGPPAGLSPSEMDALSHNGKLRSEAVTAEIVNLAVMGAIKIKEIENKFWIFKSKDYEIIRSEKFSDSALGEHQKKLLASLFSLGNGNAVIVSHMRNKFSSHFKEIGETVQNSLEKKGLVVEYSYRNMKIVAFLSVLFFVGTFIAFQLTLIGQGIGLALSGLIGIIFSSLMAKKTTKGAEIDWKIKGFRLFMETAEKYRSEFQEKENIFEKLLSYAIAFGITKQWIKKMKDIYGEDFYASYAPAWYAGSVAGANFDLNSLTASMSSLSSAIGSNVSSSSGAGGSGGSGGGGGGGGGGGW